MVARRIRTDTEDHSDHVEQNPPPAYSDVITVPGPQRMRNPQLQLRKRGRRRESLLMRRKLRRLCLFRKRDSVILQRPLGMTLMRSSSSFKLSFGTVKRLL
jgi:hypothetical protein